MTYQFGDACVDLKRMVLTRGGVQVDVEPKAFDVLRHLLEHSDRLVTKEELLDTVWRDTFVTPNVLTRAVAELRKALGDVRERRGTSRPSPGGGMVHCAAVVLAIALGSFALARRLPPAAERLTTCVGNNTTPAMSPAGRAVAFVSDRTGRLEIYVVGLAPGSEKRAITSDGGQNMQPDWSPDGR